MPVILNNIAGDAGTSMGEYFPNDIGFIDAHVHLQDRQGIEDIIAAGVIAVRDAGSPDAAGLNMPGAGDDCPVVRSCGWALFKKGGYGDRFGRPVESRDDIRSAISRLAHAGADIIKSMASGIVSLKRPGTITRGGFTVEELRIIVQEAANHGLGVMAHANGPEAIMAAVEAGVRSIEHGFFMTRTALDLMAKKGIFWVPTVGALQRAADAAAASKETRQFISARISAHLDMIGHAYAAGVPLALGTDSVVPSSHYDAAYASEFRFFERSGIPSERVVGIASESGKQLLGL